MDAVFEGKYNETVCLKTANMERTTGEGVDSCWNK